MALQDLTPQLRTRLSRVERTVGWFVFFAAILLVGGFVYYIYHTAERKGWFTPKFKFQTSLNNAAGLKEKDPVVLMGKVAGEITDIIPNDPKDYYGITINFVVLKPHYGYIWDDSVVKVSSDFLGKRVLEITKGKTGVATIDEDTNKVPVAMLRWKVIGPARKKIFADLNKTYPEMAETNAAKFDWLVKDELKRRVSADRGTFYTNLTETYWIEPAESPALNERLERVANQIEIALPNILNLTNKLNAVLDNATLLASNLNIVASDARPLLANLKTVTAQLDGPGTLGEWLLPTNVNQHLESSLNTVDTNLPALFAEITTSLENLSQITSNLNAQVRANPNILSSVSKSVNDTDDLVQGLKRHWLLRSAFKASKTNSPPKK